MFVVNWDPVSQCNHTSLLAVVIPTYSPRSVHNSFVIKNFGGVIVLRQITYSFLIILHNIVYNQLLD